MTIASEQPLTVRTMTRDDLRNALEWAAAEDWNPGTHDAPAFFAADPGGFFVAELAGEPVACISATRSGEDFGFIGVYIVRPGHRGRGFGLTVWAAGMEPLAGRKIGLDGVISQMPNYERSGFRFAHHTTRYAGVGGGDRPAGLVPLNSVPFESVAGYDATCFPARRDAFLREWIALPESTALAATGPGGLTGYGVLRKSVNGHKVGPLFADDAETAIKLLSGLVAAIPGEPFTIDIPDDTAQPCAGSLVSGFGLTGTFRTARMYAGGVPQLQMNRVFGVTSLELG